MQNILEFKNKKERRLKTQLLPKGLKLQSNWNSLSATRIVNNEKFQNPRRIVNSESFQMDDPWDFFSNPVLYRF